MFRHRVNLLTNIGLVVILGFFIGIAFLLVSPTAKASSSNVVKYQGNFGDGCSQSGGLMSVQVYIAMVNQDNGKLVEYAKAGNMKVRVTSDDPQGNNDNGIIKVSNWPQGNWTKEKVFDNVGEPDNFEKCNTNRYISYFGYGASFKQGDQSALVFEGLEYGSNNEWRLSCGFGTIGKYSRTFTFAGIGDPGVPSGYETGKGWNNDRGEATISSAQDINFDNFAIILNYNIKKKPADNDPTIDTLVNRLRTDERAVDRKEYAASGGKPLAKFEHWFKGKSLTDIKKYDVDISALCGSGPGLSGGGQNGEPIDTDCEKYSFWWQDADPWNEDKYTHWEYWLPPGGPYCENQIYKAWIKPDGVAGSWTASASGPQACITIIEWSLAASTTGYINGSSASNYQTAFSNQNVVLRSSVTNVGEAPLDLDLDVNVMRSPAGSDYFSLDQKRGWPEGSRDSQDNKVTSLGLNCENVWAAQTEYDSGAKSFDSFCIHIISPSVDVPTTIQYEKGQTGLVIGGDILVNNGGSCPVNAVNIPYKATINGQLSTGSFNYGGGYGCNPPSNLLSISSSLATTLNGKAPGDSGIQYCLNVNNQGDSCGSIIVIEVPFARFYGNDIYATSGNITFNDAYNNDSSYDGRGSVAQYAALASSPNTKIDSAAFRLNALVKPNAPNGLDPDTTSYLSNTSATKVYNDVVNKIPTNCGTTPSSYLLPSSSGCYRVSDDYRLTGIPRIGGSDGITCLDKQRINPLHTCGFPNNFEYITSNYDKKITLYNPDPNKPFMIVGDIVNTSASYSNPSSTGVMLIVSAGDIIIDNNVKRVDAILISNKGIYTCGWTWAPGYGSKVGQNQIDETCTSNLTINGSLSAKTIDFRRVGGSRYLSNGLGDTIDGSWNCLAWKGIKNCGDRGDMPLDTGKTAEIVNFPAYLYWATPYLLDQAKSGGTNEAMFVAPPRL